MVTSTLVFLTSLLGTVCLASQASPNEATTSRTATTTSSSLSFVKELKNVTKVVGEGLKLR